jgi:hypothetical protein
MAETPKWQRARVLDKTEAGWTPDPNCPTGTLLWVRIQRPAVRVGRWQDSRLAQGSCLRCADDRLVMAEAVELLPVFSSMDNPDEVLDA